MPLPQMQNQQTGIVRTRLVIAAGACETIGCFCMTTYLEIVSFWNCLTKLLATVEWSKSTETPIVAPARAACRLTL